MSGIFGFLNFNRNLNTNDYKNILLNMSNKTCSKCTNDTKISSDNHIYLGSNNLSLINKDIDEQPITLYYEKNKYTIIFNGNLYNSKELKNILNEKGFFVETGSDLELILKAYICFGNNVVNKLNGAFAFCIWNANKQELFFARDHLGVKPFYYSLKDDFFVFATEIKTIFEFPDIVPKLDKQGISELFGIGPCHTPGTTVFNGIFELKPGHYGIYNKYGISFTNYWKLESKPYNDNLSISCDKIKFLLEDSITNQIKTDDYSSLCTFLSGGLDSSIISLYASNFYKENKLGKLKTFSVDYIDNDKNFKKTDFQPDSDNFYIDLMKNKLDTNHMTIMLDTPDLANYLEDAMILRDMPGMADVDSSLLLFCMNVKDKSDIALTGECADEIFGGYPWFFKNDSLNLNTFPWSIALDERQNLLNKYIGAKINLKDYTNYRYNECLNEVEILDCDSTDTAQKRKMSYLTLKFFMQTLLDRSDKMAMFSNFEIRVPFCDYRIAQYVWNIPWEIKSLNGREKGLLRYIMKDMLPTEIINRKKSPYPKTWNPTYLKVVKDKLYKIMENNNSPINDLLNKDYILEILKTDGKSFTRPWFGQLMTGPQLIAYLCQVNQWLDKYKPQINL